MRRRLRRWRCSWGQYSGLSQLAQPSTSDHYCVTPMAFTDGGLRNGNQEMAVGPAA